MPQAENWMFPQHSRAGVTHDGADLFPAVFLIAMHRALGASRLFRSKTAAVQPHTGIIEQSPAFRTQPALVMILTIDADHRLDGPPLTLKTFALAARERLFRRRSGFNRHPTAFALQRFGAGNWQDRNGCIHRALTFRLQPRS